MSNGDTAIFAGPIEKLLGVYSGRISEESDLGIVWRREVIAEIIDAELRGRAELPTKGVPPTGSLRDFVAGFRSAPRTALLALEARR